MCFNIFNLPYSNQYFVIPVSCILADGNQVTESSDTEIKSKDLPVKNEGLKVQLGATESSELNIEEPEPAEEDETSNKMDLEQETGF